MLMRMDQPRLMPSPRCLDSPPAGMMQLRHRESVVQFVKEVRCCSDAAAQTLLDAQTHQPAQTAGPGVYTGTDAPSSALSPAHGLGRLLPLPARPPTSAATASTSQKVCEDFQLLNATVGLAVSYFDRYLSSTDVRGLETGRVQLLAVTCVRLAAKFAEVKMPSLEDIVEIAQGVYTKAQLKEMELEVLRVLQWELHAVTPHAALEQLTIAIGRADKRVVLEHAEFYIDLSYYVVSKHRR